MGNFCINMMPRCILEKLFSLKEVSMFVLPNSYILEQVYSNNWAQIITEKLINVKKRHKSYLVVEFTTFNLLDQSIFCEEFILLKNNLFNKIIYYLERKTAVCLVIKSYTFEYGYLIIPSHDFENKE